MTTIGLIATRKCTVRLSGRANLENAVRLRSVNPHHPRPPVPIFAGVDKAIVASPKTAKVAAKEGEEAARLGTSSKQSHL